jgi:hypothetical protein
MEGEFSMYIDGVVKKAYKSSYQLDKPYNLDYRNDENKKSFRVKEAFARIRKDNGLMMYDELGDHYYSKAKHYWEEK